RGPVAGLVPEEAAIDAAARLNVEGAGGGGLVGEDDRVGRGDQRRAVMGGAGGGGVVHQGLPVDRRKRLGGDRGDRRVLGVAAPGSDRGDGDHAALEVLQDRLVVAAPCRLVGSGDGSPRAQEVPNHVL